MRLKDVRKELERRSLPVEGDREALESRLQHAMNDELGLGKEDEIDAKIARQSKVKGFEFGVLKAHESVQGVAPMDVDEGDHYPMRNDYLTLNSENSGKPSILSRLGSGRAPRCSILNRLTPKVGSIKDRLKYPLGSDGDANREIPESHLPNSVMDVDFPEANSENVFDENHKKARAERFALNNNLEQGSTQKIIELPSSGEPSQPTISLIEEFQEYDIEKMEERAQKLAHCPTHIPTLKRRARRFDEECANELAQVSMAKKKNDRFKRFKLGDESSSEEEEEDI